MPGKIRYFVETPSPNNSTAAVMRLEVNGSNVAIADNCGGFAQFVTLLTENPALDAEASGATCSGGPAPSGVDNCIVFLGSTVAFPALEKGRLDIGAITFQVTHTAAAALTFDSMMAYDLDWVGGQLVLNPAASGQIGVLIQPRNQLPQDTHGPVVTASRMVFPSIVATAGIGQICALFSHAYAPIIANRGFEFTEPNGGDYGICVAGAGHGFTGNPLIVNGAHGQKYGCVDIGHGAALVGGGNYFRCIVAPEPTWGTGFDCWSAGGDLADINIIPGDTGNGWRGITLEAGSKGLQARVGMNVAATPVLVGATGGHSWINGVAYG